jgi:SAM-dependent methyltransferase
MPKSIEASIYDFPKYYDMIFNADWATEVRFVDAALKKHASRKVKRVYEPACGTGRLLVKLAKLGYEVSGNDLNPKAVDYCNRRLHRHDLPESVEVADMCNFKLKRKVDGAFNLINTFRHLGTEEQAEAHLRCMAEALNKGGVYLLGLHLLAAKGQLLDEESWSGRRGGTTVTSYMWTKKIDRPGRMEYLGMNIDVTTPTKTFRIEDEMHYRTYTLPQMKTLLARVPAFEIAETYDFHCDINKPHVVSDWSQDVIFVLRKK